MPVRVHLLHVLLNSKVKAAAILLALHCHYNPKFSSFASYSSMPNHSQLKLLLYKRLVRSFLDLGTHHQEPDGLKPSCWLWSYPNESKFATCILEGSRLRRYALLNETCGYGNETSKELLCGRVGNKVRIYSNLAPSSRKV